MTPELIKWQIRWLSVTWLYRRFFKMHIWQLGRLKLKAITCELYKAYFKTVTQFSTSIQNRRMLSSGRQNDEDGKFNDKGNKEFVLWYDFIMTLLDNSTSVEFFGPLILLSFQSRPGKFLQQIWGCSLAERRIRFIPSTILCCIPTEFQQFSQTKENLFLTLAPKMLIVTSWKHSIQWWQEKALPL